MNTRLREHPELLTEEGDGYVAVGLPKPENIDAIKGALLTTEQYEELTTKLEQAEKSEGNAESTGQLSNDINA